MKPKQFKHHIQKINLIRMIFPSIFLLFLIYAIIRFPIINCLFPTETDNSQAPSELYNSNTYYVNISTGKLYYTGYDYLKGSSVNGHYFYSLSDERCTIYLFSTAYFPDGVPATIDSATFKGKLLSKSSNRTQLLTLIAKDLNWTYDGLNSYTDTVIVSQMDYAVIPSIFLTIFIYFSFSFSLAHVLILLHNIIRPQYAYSFISLGHGKVRREAILDASAELETSVHFSAENMHVTNTFFIYTGRYNIAIIPLKNMAWAYKYSRLHKYYLFGEMTYTIKIITKNKRIFLFNQKTKQAADDLLAYLEKANPDMLIGYTKENYNNSKNFMRSILHFFK